MNSALEGIRVLDLSVQPPGAFCTMILGEWGAEVIKVEALPKPGTRRFGSTISPIGESERRRAAFNALNRNKKSLGVDLKSEDGRKLFYRLAQASDVVVEGFRPGVVKRLGIDYPTIKKLNPRIVYCSISGYGQDGPYSNDPGHDINYISFAGALGLIGERKGRPVIPLNLVADYAGGALHPVMGVMAALLSRERTGKGQFVDISITDCVISLLSITFSEYFLTGIPAMRGETMLGGAFPYFNLYQAKDGKYLTIGCLDPWFWGNLCRELGREDLIPYQHDVGEKREEIFAFLRKTFLTRNRDEWYETLVHKDIPIAKVYDMEEVFSDPQALHRGMLAEIDDPVVGKVKQVGIGIKLSETPGTIRSLSPIFGEHTDEIMHSLGYSSQEIEKIRQKGAIA